MRKRSSMNANQMAADVLRAATEQPDKNPAAVALGRRGGLKGGKARADKLSPRERTQIARKAAQARWGKGADGKGNRSR
jgi:hypothetical protein